MSKNPSNQSPLLHKMSPNPDLSQLLNEFSSILTFIVPSGGEIQVTSLIGLCMVEVPRT